MSSYLLTECTDDGKYNAVHCLPVYKTQGHASILAAAAATMANVTRIHGPAIVSEVHVDQRYERVFIQPTNSTDIVRCIRCLSWPPQVADWPTRHREYGWPDSATVDCVVSNGCDVVPVSHSLCKQDEWMSAYQWRLSFSRAEIVLLNSWMPVQQIVYHMLRKFVKTERLTDSADAEVKAFTNYHIKTLML